MSLRYETPLERDLALELFEFWERVFGPHEPDVPLHVYLGSECRHNRNVVYLEREGDELAGTCGMAIGRATPALAGFGEVATEPRWRGRGIAELWANITSGDSPEEYLADYFRDSTPVRISNGDASLRVPMIPLLLTPHDWQVLDGNLPVPMLSTEDEDKQALFASLGFEKGRPSGAFALGDRQGAAVETTKT